MPKPTYFNAKIIRKKWIDFFQKHDHYFLKPLCLVPENDKSLLFVNSGVAAIKKYFVGDEKLPKNRIVNCQKVIRTNDIENIGITNRHHSFFEMLGSFSINDYFKKEAVEMCLDFLINHLEMDKNNLYFTVHNEDSETYQIYLNLGISKDKLINCDSDRNFWNMGNGPCGPCTEIYYDRGPEYDKRGIELLEKDIENQRYLEIWNIVFSEFINCDGKFQKSSSRNIDTGAGLERLATIKENKRTNFENSLFEPIINTASSFSEVKYCQNNHGDSNKNNSLYQIISDHFRSVIMILNDGVLFGNKDRQYILRKLFRRAMSAAWILQIDEEFLVPTIEATINTLNDFYTNLDNNKTHIIEQIKEEYRNFKPILMKTNMHVDKLIDSGTYVDIEKKVFTLFERHGVPIDLIEQRLFSKNILFSKEKYLEIFETHRIGSKNQKFNSAFGDFETSNKDVCEINETEFLYDLSELCDVKISRIYDENNKSQNTLHNQSGYLVLEKTILFPESAGQDRDCGWINTNAANTPKTEIIDIKKNEKLEILHKVNSGIFKIGDTVSVLLDKSGRKGVSLHHTLEHLIYAFLQQEISPNLKRESAKKTQYYSKISFEKPSDLDLITLIKNIETRGKEVIKNSVKVESWYSTPEKCDQLKLDYKKLIKTKKATDQFRIIKIANITTELCAGTHLNNTNEIEDLIISECVKKSGNIYEMKFIGGESNIFNTLKEQEIIDKSKFQEIFNKIQNIDKELNLNENSKKSNKLNFPDDLNYSKNFIDKRTCFFETKMQINDKLSELNQIYKEKLAENNQFKLNKFKNQLLMSSQEIFCLLEVKEYGQKELLKFLQEYKLPNQMECLIVLNEINNYAKSSISFLISGDPKISLNIFNHLKNKFGASGGGKKVISGNINNHSNNPNFIFELKKFIHNSYN